VRNWITASFAGTTIDIRRFIPGQALKQSACGRACWPMPDEEICSRRAIAYRLEQTGRAPSERSADDPVARPAHAGRSAPEPTARLPLHPRVSAADQAPRGGDEVRHRCTRPEGDRSRSGAAPLTLSSAVKASLFGIMSWRCLAQSEHGIARPRTWHALGGFRQCGTASQ
jgi:hypothetical protein